MKVSYIVEFNTVSAYINKGQNNFLATKLLSDGEKRVVIDDYFYDWNSEALRYTIVDAVPELINRIMHNYDDDYTRLYKPIIPKIVINHKEPTSVKSKQTFTYACVADNLALSVIMGEIIGIGLKAVTAPEVATQVEETAGNGLKMSEALGMPVKMGETVKTHYGNAVQEMSKEALKLKKGIGEGEYVYRACQFGRSNATNAKFWSPENPMNIGYDEKYGVDSENVDYIIKGKMKSGADFITRPEPGLGSNVGGGLEVVTNSNDVIINSYIMP